MLTRAVLLAAFLTLVAAAGASAQLPKPIGAPGGIYTGKVAIGGERCTRCKVRLVLTADGLEITGRSTISLAGSRCYGVVRSTVELARLRADHSFSTNREEEGTGYPLRGSVTRSRASGRGTALCGDREKSLRFTARRSGRAQVAAGTLVRCEVLGEYDAKTIFLTAQRGLGCGIAHDAARGRRAGVKCAVVEGGTFEPAAQTRCTRGAAALEVARLANCTTREMEDYGAANSAYVHATAAAGCAEAATVGKYLIDCDDVAGTCDSPPDGYVCKTDKALDDSTSDTAQRCTVPSDPRKLLVLRYYSSDVV